MTPQSRRLAGILLLVFPTVMIGGVSLLSPLISDPAYAPNPLRQDLWRAGHAHAGVLLVLSLIVLRYVDEARLSERTKSFIRLSVPSEKELTRRSDELARRRQVLPWVRIEKEYRFETDEGSASLADLFRGCSQLLVYPFMFGPDYTGGVRPARRSRTGSMGLRFIWPIMT